ncbi:uncharacterized protein LOC126367652 [Pectinophora gossypiella]|uniref:uncharacterized protein LOC126367652 n=1 Tax=Pectinophora gossypiella TaxID=13191 RepID=UPI00214E6498|nr:uncharacterized protein LOC126367652 [Pectinophora gossypiella]
MSDYVQTAISKRGKVVLVIDGYEMCLNKTVGTKKYWCCALAKEKQCRSTVTTDFHSVIEKETINRSMSEHSHAPNAALLDELKLRTNLKRDAASSQSSPAQLIQQNLAQVPSTSACSMPSKDALRHVIRRARKKILPAEPKSIDEIQIPDNLKTVEGEKFLAKDVTYGNNKRLLMFCTKAGIQILRDAILWLMDGTFRTCPNLFTQLYSIHAIVGHDEDSKKILPVLYCFLMDKSEETYMAFFQALKEYAMEFEYILNPQYILTDYEMAVINTVKIEFPDAEHKGCLFHLGQNVWRKIQSSGLQSLYGSNSEFALKIRHIVALAYLPHEEIPEAFRVLKNEVLPKEAESVTLWFENYYVLGKVKSQQINSTKLTVKRKNPMFPPKLWSVYTNNELNLPRTQNNVEAWHRRWNYLLNNNRYGVYVTISHLQKEQITTNHAIEKSMASITRTPPKKKGKRTMNAIKRICDNRENMTTLSFLRAIATHLEF